MYVSTYVCVYVCMCVCILQASFAADGSSDINMDDPDFWKKWAEKANLDLDELANKVTLTASGCVPLWLQ